MTTKRLMKDPLNLIIIGVAGQGNVLISQLVCQALANEGYLVTLGQTYSSNQRGGSVNSVSHGYSTLSTRCTVR